MKQLRANNIKENITTGNSDMFQLSNAQNINIFDVKEAAFVT